MTASAELRFIRALTKDKPFIPAKTIEMALNKAKAKWLNKHSRNTDLKLEAEIRLCEIERCKNILEEIER